MKTVKFAIMAIGLVATMSCTKQYYQIAQTKPVDQSILKNDNDDSGYYYEDRYCTVMYDFWKLNGDAGFTIVNKTDQILYIVKDKSFYVKNGVSFEYYGDENFEKQLPVIGIAPHAQKKIGNYVIDKTQIVDCDLNIKPQKNEPATMGFTLENSPVVFGNVITYRVGEKGPEQTVQHMFYVNRVTNYLQTDLFRMEMRKNCKNVSANASEYIQIIRFAPATGYYQKYNK